MGAGLTQQARHLPQPEWLFIEQPQETNTAEDMEKEEFLFIIGGSYSGLNDQNILYKKKFEGKK